MATLRRSEALSEMEAASLAKVRILEEQLTSRTAPLEVQIGATLRARGETVLRKFAKKDNEPISRNEMRLRVRKLCPRAEASELDRLFDEMDLDGDGRIDAEELLAASERFGEMADVDATVERTLAAQLDEQRESSKRAQQACAATVAAEKAQAELAEVKGHRSVGLRLGAAFAASSTKIEDVVINWGRHGVVSLDDWRQNLKNLGIRATVEE